MVFLCEGYLRFRKSEQGEGMVSERETKVI